MPVGVLQCLGCRTIVADTHNNGFVSNQTLALYGVQCTSNVVIDEVSEPLSRTSGPDAYRRAAHPCPLLSRARLLRRLELAVVGVLGLTSFYQLLP